MTEKNSQRSGLSPRNKQNKTIGLGIIGIIVAIISAVLFPHPTSIQYLVTRLLMSFGFAGAFVMLPGSFQIKMPNWLSATGSIAIVVFIFYFNPPPPPPTDGVTLQIIVLSPDGMVVKHPHLVATPGGPPSTDNEGRCTIEIPPNIPPGTRIKIRADEPGTSLSGKVEVDLANATRQDIEIQLTQDRTGTLHGIVTDTDGHALEGAQVSVSGYESQPVTTNRKGEFALAAHTGNDETVRLVIDKEGFVTENPDVQVGTTRPITIKLSALAR